MWKAYPTSMHFCIVLFFVISSFIGFHGPTGVNGRRPRFLGSGYIALPKLQNAEQYQNIQLKIYPEFLNGLILFSGRFANASSDFFSLFLDDGYLILRVDCGGGIKEVRAPERLQLGINHTIYFTRNGRSLNLRRDGNNHTEGMVPGSDSLLTFNANLYVGGHPNMKSISLRVGTRYQFEGCVQVLNVGGHIYNLLPVNDSGEVQFEDNVGDCIQSECDRMNCSDAGECINAGGNSSCMCPYGYINSNCNSSRNVLRYPAFHNDMYIKSIVLPVLQNSGGRFTIALELKPYLDDVSGSLLYSGELPEAGPEFFSLSMENGYAIFRWNCGSGVGKVTSAVTLPSMVWSTIYVNRTGTYASIKINSNGSVVEGNSPGSHNGISICTFLYLGNFDVMAAFKSRTGTSSTFNGCISLLRINNHRYDLSPHSLERENNTENPSCSPTNPCTNFTCWNGGRCAIDAFDQALCLCPEGYNGIACENVSD